MFHTLCDMTECFAIGEELSLKLEKEPLTDKTVKFVVNADIATDVLRKGGVYMYGNCVLPYVFLSCQRCWDKSNFKVVARCFECDAHMIDHGVKLEVDGEQVEYCRVCLDVDNMITRVKKYAPERLNALSALGTMEDISWEDIRTASWDRMENPIYQSIQKANTTRQDFRRTKLQKEQDEHNKKMERKIRLVFLRGYTELTHETITRIQTVLQFEQAPSSVDELLNIMLDYSVKLKQVAGL
jgi:hypothetical protein